MSDAAGFVIVLETPVHGTVDMWSSQAVSKDEAIQLLNLALNKNGYTARVQGRNLIVASKDDAKKQNIPIHTGSDPAEVPETAEMVMQIIPLRHIDATQASRDLGTLLPGSATLTANADSNSLVVTDTQINVHHIVEIVAALDSSADTVSTVRVFPLKNADPVEMAQLLTSLFATPATPAQNGAAGGGFARFGALLGAGGFGGGAGAAGGGGGGGGFGGGGERRRSPRRHHGRRWPQHPGRRRRRSTHFLGRGDRLEGPDAGDRRDGRPTRHDLGPQAEGLRLHDGERRREAGRDHPEESLPEQQRAQLDLHPGRPAQHPRHQQQPDDGRCTDPLDREYLRREKPVSRPRRPFNHSHPMKTPSVKFLFRGLLAAALLLLGAASAAAQAVGQARPGGAPANPGATGGSTGSSSSGATRQYMNSTMVGDAMITSDMDTRRIIVVTDDLTNDSIRTVVASLDKPRPQVQIDVIFLQVEHDKDLDLGAEASYTAPIAINSQPATGTASTNFGVSAAQALGTTYGGFYSIANSKVNATIHLLASTNKTQILSRPSILTRSGQQATVMVGQQIPLITNSQVSALTNAITNTVTYQPVGIILTVTPFITADGNVEMIVSPQTSSLSSTTVPISNGVNSPVINQTSADTVVVTPSDKTVVIGGLISSQKNDTEDKVPILGDIPLLGAAFRHKVAGTTKTELLIFLTPHVVDQSRRPRAPGRRQAGKPGVDPAEPRQGRAG